MIDTYSPRPWHLVYSVILFALGAWCFHRGVEWYYFAVGVMLWILAWVVIGWIVYASIAEHRARYWDSVSDAIDSANKSDIEKIASLGFTQKDIPNRLSVELTDKRDGSNNSKYFELPISGVKLVPLARAVLNGQAFTERRFTGTSGLLSADEFRRLRAVMRDKGLIEPISEKDSRQGYRLTKAGVELFSSIAE